MTKSGGQFAMRPLHCGDLYPSLTPYTHVSKLVHLYSLQKQQSLGRRGPKQTSASSVTGGTPRE